MLRSNFKNQVNAVGGASVAVVAAFLTYEFARSREISPCGRRYPTVTEMALSTSAGEPFANAQFQAAVGVSGRDIVEKATIVKVDNRSIPLALGVAVGGKIASDTGLSFFWQPSGMASAKAACLSYDVLLPADFDFARGGKLPGLSGGTISGASGSIDSSVSVHISWDPRGLIGVEATTAPSPETAATAEGPARLAYASELEFPRNRWVHFEQEVNLNTPAAADGALRLWIDGHLVMEEGEVSWQSDGKAALTGAVADISYRSTGGIEVEAKKVSRILVSPLRLSWQ